ncbi:hypothetical protein CRENPOLYSF2_3470001 [Crenothrix polyspora]|uniref:PIN domain-containing protein n=1 Tax=Crenothrix polyspora TaxID=360316 RepID=A0A1R4HBR5_9GAMM|nr:hypothetical protein [Crenothrix polyspora]SJM93627.1 hypothetical protein CRENPOLYSF2_3470001 [Crenothrix polyspora]
MIGLDTNILARFYVDDPNDSQALNQRPIARRIMTESPQATRNKNTPIFSCKLWLDSQAVFWQQRVTYYPVIDRVKSFFGYFHTFFVDRL